MKRFLMAFRYGSASLALILTCAQLALANDVSDAKQKQIESTFSSLIEKDLLQVRKAELENIRVRRLNVDRQIQLKNEAALLDLNAYRTERIVEGRMNSISRQQAQEILNSIYEHPVVSDYHYNKYNRPGVEIGFCFGRAAYVHLALLKFGINKDSIKKVWAVGPMVTGETAWDFHVATIVKSTDGSWIVIDNFVGQIMTIEEWLTNISKLAQTGHKVRYYFTEPKKFSVSLGDYDRVQLGLDLSKDQDWYKGYFTDLMKWFQEQNNQK
jgi:hypothetical protein